MVHTPHYHGGNLDLIPELQQAFARSVLGEEIPREVPGDDLVYDIDRLLEPGFEFQYPADLGKRIERMLVLSGVERTAVAEDGEP